MAKETLFKPFVLFNFLFCFISFCSCEFGEFISTVTWNTMKGDLTGTRYKVGEDYVYKFKQVPYARPPIGKLRFRKPQMADPWKRTLNATEYGPSCIQAIYPNDMSLIPNLSITEDCLQLNIFVPRIMSKEQRLSTMVWVHGGSLTNGQGTMFDGSMLALRGNIIVVTINYRLNVFGFFAAGDVKGNFGIYDQQLAFQWVKENIADYGGDAGSITIFGESAGGDSVTLHSLLPSNMNLFHRVIAESGSIVSKNYRVPFTETSRAASFKIAKLIKCITVTNEVDFTCLQNKSSHDIFQAYLNVTENSMDLSFVGDNELVPTDIIDQINDPSTDVYKMLQSVDLMAGVNSGEAGLMIYDLQKLGINETDDISTTLLCDQIVPLMMEPFIENCTSIRNAVCDIYTPNGNNRTLAMQSQLASHFLTDIMFLAPTELLLNYHAANSSKRTYQYYFTHLPAWELIQITRPKWLTGPNHASELTFVFGMDWYPSNVTIKREERDLSNRMIDYWTNFAKFGDPYNDSSVGLTYWEPYTLENKSYLRLDIKDSLGTNLQTRESLLLNDQVPKLLQDCRDENNYTVLSTSLGLLKGLKTIYNGETVFQFKQIPYAQPPIGELRFSKPVYHEPWANLRDAQNFGLACYQSGTNDSEDCLFLNVFVPRNLSSMTARPVMIWVHGGGFTTGRIDTTDGSVLALSGDVIVVTIQYRLNVFGFFSLNRKPCMGNYGLYDQQFAIKWVKNNIANFGGDPDSITLFGESAGGVSTTLQAIIPSNKGLFHRVIGESGSALAHRDFQTKTFETSKRILATLRCSDVSDDQVLSCLRSKDVKAIFDAYTLAARDVSIVYSLTTTIGPIVDGDLIPQNPLEALENDNSDSYRMFSSVDILVGTNTADAGLLYFNIESRDKEFNFNSTVGVPTKVLCDYIAPAITRDIFKSCPGISAKICKKYSPISSNTSLQVQSHMAANLYGDLLEDAPTVRFLELHGNTIRSKSYQYLFAHRPRWELISVRPTWLVGANHASEVVFVFGLLRQWYPDSVPVMDDEVKLSHRMMTFWTNFARHGNPNGATGDTWPAFDVKSRKYLVFGIVDHVNNSLYNDRMVFWNTEIANDFKNCKKEETNASLKRQYDNILFCLIVVLLFLI